MKQNPTKKSGAVQLEIVEPLLLQGRGQGELTIDGLGATRPIDFSATTGDLTLAGITLQNGSTSADGGGIRFASNGQLRLLSSQVINNTGGFNGGGIFSNGDVSVLSSTVSGNTASGNGGGIYGQSAVSIVESTISGNTVDGSSNSQLRGGGVFASGTLTAVQSSILNNILPDGNTQGGGVFSATNVNLSKSTVAGNRAGERGGGVQSLSGVFIDSSTISGNTAGQSGGGISAEEILEIEQSTVVNNTANDAGGVRFGDSVGSTLSFINHSVVAANIAAGDLSFPETSALAITRTLVGNNAGTNLVVSPTADANGNFIGSEAAPIDPRLSDLGDFGGPTLTHLPLVGSPVSNAGSGIVLNSATDQRGRPRNALGGLDLGSVELQADEQGEAFDFGDAPVPFPVTLADDGARHATSSLFLGASVNSDVDGINDQNADGDGLDDGVGLIASVVTEIGSTITSSLQVIASENGLLDGWIDFNRDGDWDDAGEQIATSFSLSTGLNVLPFTVAPNSFVGDTAARFRISSTGGLSPTGAAGDGEVEDYLFTILDGDANPTVTIDPVDLTTTIILASDALVVQGANEQLFQAPLSTLGPVEITAIDDNALITLDLSSGNAVPNDGLTINGSAGSNSLAIIGTVDVESSLDLTNTGSLTTSNFDSIDLSGDGNITLTLDDAVVARLNPTNFVIDVAANPDDTIVVERPEEWRLNDPISALATVVLTAVHTTGNGEQIQTNGLNVWQNFLQPSDVNNTGDITALDALVIINELGARRFSDADGVLINPANVTGEFPDFYDQNNDLKVSALDALRVINELSRVTIEPELVPISAIAEGESTKVFDDPITLEFEFTQETRSLNSRPVFSQPELSPVDAEDFYNGTDDELDQLFGNLAMLDDVMNLAPDA